MPFDVGAYVSRSTSGPLFRLRVPAREPRLRAHTIAETDTAIAFLNRYPTLFGYTIVAPKAHLEHVTGDFTEDEYVGLQRFLHRVAEAMRRVLAPERIYVLSLGSQAANAHVHWHIAPLPSGVPLEQQQYHALMHENGVVDASRADIVDYIAKMRVALLI